MTPFEEAQQRANAIHYAGFENMFVTISWGCEYCNSYDVLPKPSVMDIDSDVAD